MESVVRRPRLSQAYRPIGGDNRFVAEETSAGDVVGLDSDALGTESGPWEESDTTPLKPSNNRRARRYSGWRFGLLVSACATTVICIINGVLAIWLLTKRPVSGSGAILEGSCKTVSNLSLGSHLLINILGSILLAASSYCMQCLAAPTRKDCDRAHARQSWLDIGVNSPRNLLSIGRLRLSLWVLLCFTSLTIHLLYNSVIFKVLAATEFDVGVVNPAFLVNPQGASGSEDFGFVAQMRARYLEDEQSYKMLTMEECLSNYAQETDVAWGDVFFVTQSSDIEATIYGTRYTGNDLLNTWGRDPWATYSWLCSDIDINWDRCSEQVLQQNRGNYTLGGQRIDYCLARSEPERCQLQFNIFLLAIVIGCGVLKAVCMFLTLIWQRDAPFGVIGDAIASYLQDADQWTKNQCFATRKPIKARRRPKDIHHTKEPVHVPLASVISTVQPQFLYRSVDLAQLIGTTLFMLSIFATTIGLIAMVISWVGDVFDNAQSPWSLGFGTAYSRLTLAFESPGTTTFVLAILLSNAPQLVASTFYLLYNNLLTIMLLSKEWSSYGKSAKTLRVSTPQGEQRSSYFLHVPFRYGIPLLITSIVLHWLISTAFFVVRIDGYYEGNQDPRNRRTMIGWSPLPILLILILLIIMAIAAGILGFRRHESAMPLASSKSFAIAAACHPPEGDVDAALHPVQWGETEESSTEEIGHCSFTSLRTREVKVGRLYM